MAERLERVSRWARVGLGVVFPPRCLACGEALVWDKARAQVWGDDKEAGEARGWRWFCAACHAGLVWVDTACARCALPRLAYLDDSPRHALGDKAWVCARCRRDAPPWGWASAVWEHGGAGRDAVRRLKFGKAPGAARGLGALMAQGLRVRLSQGSHRGLRAVPVPSHVRRRAERGYNQAELLARAMSTVLGLEAPLLAVQRPRAGDVQHRLGRDAREVNVRDALELAEGVCVEGARLVVVDDVMTTGATARAVARVLCDAGAAVEGVAVVTRAL